MLTPFIILLLSIASSPATRFISVWGIERGTSIELQVERTLKQDDLPALVSQSRIRVTFPVRQPTRGQLLKARMIEAAGTEARDIASIGLTESDLVFRVDLLLDEHTKITQVPNWRQLRNQIAAISNSVINQDVEQGRITDGEAMRARFANATRNEQFIREIFARKIQPYLDGYGWAFSAGETVEFDTEYPISDEIGSVSARFQAEILDDPQKERVIQIRKRIWVTDKAKEELIKKLTAIEQADSSRGVKSIAPHDLDLRDEYLWEYDRDLLQINSAEYLRVRVIPGISDAEVRTTWTVVPEKDIASDDPADTSPQSIAPRDP